MPSLKMRLGITASRVGGAHPLKACDECVLSDLERIGFASWRLEHQFPSAMICLTHHRPLFLANDPVSPVHRRDWLLPTSNNWRRTVLPRLSKRQVQELTRLAEYSNKLSAQGVNRFDHDRLATTYQTGLRRKGLCTCGGSLRLKPLVRLASQRFKGLAALPGFETLNSISRSAIGSLGTISRRASRPAHPLKHLLVINLAFDSWKEFEDAYDASIEAPPGKLQASTEGPSIGAKLRVLVTKDHLSITSAAKVVGTSTTKALEVARRESIPFAPRPKKLREPLLTQLRAQLACGATVAVASRNTGLSNVTISRLLASDTQLRALWTSARFDQKRAQARMAFRRAACSAKNKMIRTIRSQPGSSYGWLYANDRDWLANETARISSSRGTTH